MGIHHSKLRETLGLAQEMLHLCLTEMEFRITTLMEGPTDLQQSNLLMMKRKKGKRV